MASDPRAAGEIGTESEWLEGLRYEDKFPSSADLLVDALRAVLAAVESEREARMSDEYSDGGIWQAEQAIARLAEQSGGPTDG